MDTIAAAYYDGLRISPHDDSLAAHAALLLRPMSQLAP
jgi:hypothetical protein